MSSGAAAAQVVIKVAQSEEEREQVFRLRYDTYVAEMNMFAPVADHVAHRLTDSHDEHSQLLIASAGGEPVGTLRLTFGADGAFSDEFQATYGMDAFFPVVPGEAMVVSTRFIVRAAYRGTALPFQLIAAATRIGAARGVELAFCDCQPHLLNLYMRLGFRVYRPTYNDPHMALMVPLVMIVGDGDYLRQVGSPLLGTVFDPAEPTSEVARCAVGILPPKPPVRSIEQARTYDWPAEVGSERPDQALRVFEGLDDDQLAEILVHSHIIDVAPDDHLIRHGQVTRTMYVLLGGELQYWADRRHLADAAIGEAVGDVAFFLRSPRTIDVIAGPVGARVLTLNEPSLRGVMESHSPAAAILLFNLCRMLAQRIAARGAER